MITGAVIGFMFWCVVIWIGMGNQCLKINYGKAAMLLLITSGFCASIGYLFS